MALRYSIVCWSAALAALAPATVAVAAPTTVRASVSSTGQQANAESRTPAISGDGRFVAFYSGASNLVAGDANGRWDVFVHDRTTGQTSLVSVSSSGVQGNADSGLWEPAISANGRYVAFPSGATTLIPGDDPNVRVDQVYVHDRDTGQTTRVSVSSSGVKGSRASATPSLSADGRYVAFTSWANNLVPGDTNKNPITDETIGDVFVHDRDTSQTTRVSVSSSGGQGDKDSREPAISADGRYVVFASEATNLVTGDTNETWDVFVHDRNTQQTARVSVSSAGVQGNDVTGVEGFSISGNGRYVAFISRASNLVADDTNGWADTFVHDRDSGQTTRVSVSSSGDEANSNSYRCSISADGRYVAFDSAAYTLTENAPGGPMNVFVHDRDTGQTTCVSVTPAGEAGGLDNWDPSLSADGQYVAFYGVSSGLVEDDTNEWPDIFVRGPLIATGPAPYTLADVIATLQAAGGLETATNLPRLNLEEAAAGLLDMKDAVRIARKVAGLEPNP